MFAHWPSQRWLHSKDKPRGTVISQYLLQGTGSAKLADGHWQKEATQWAMGAQAGDLLVPFEQLWEEGTSL